ncbi:MAG: DUF47 family protein [Streptococcaceae bacterium]|nr:DUF47 family protein [Streptococcaceae bacterium]
MAREKFDYFAAMTDIAKSANKAATALKPLLADYEYHKFILQAEPIHELENQADAQVRAISDQLAISFMTPIDREDISYLTECLDNVMDGINEFTYLLENLVVTELHPGAEEFMDAIIAATEGMVVACGEFAKFKNSKSLKEYIRKVRSLENGADKLYSQVVKDMYTNETDPVEIIKWRDLYNRLERTVNDTEICVKVIGNLVIKNT